MPRTVGASARFTRRGSKCGDGPIGWWRLVRWRALKLRRSVSVCPRRYRRPAGAAAANSAWSSSASTFSACSLVMAVRISSSSRACAALAARWRSDSSAASAALLAAAARNRPRARTRPPPSRLRGAPFRPSSPRAPHRLRWPPVCLGWGTLPLRPRSLV